MVITQTDRLKAIISNPANAPMGIAKIIEEEIREFEASDEYKLMLEARQYYRNRSDVQKKTNDIAKRSNTRIEHPFLKRAIDQKVSYLLSKDFTLDTDNPEYGKALIEALGDRLRPALEKMGRNALVYNEAYMLPYFDDSGALTFLSLDPLSTIVLWRDLERTLVDGFIRYYDQVIYEGNAKKTIRRAEYWHADGITYFKGSDSAPKILEIDTDYGTPATGYTVPHFVYGEQPMNWERVPLVWIRHNYDGLPMHYYLKDLIDDYNWQTSLAADALRDIAKFIYVIKNYGGTNLDEFVDELHKVMAIKVDTDGGVDTISPKLDITALMSFLDTTRKNLFDFAYSVDTKDAELGNASGVAINFRYTDLENDAQSLAREFKRMLADLKLFIDVAVQYKTGVDYTGESLGITFNTDMPVNETEIMDNIGKMDGKLSQRTLLKQNPWVKDVDAEIEQLKKERKEAMKEFGTGLFNGTFGLNPTLPPQGGEPE